MKKVFLLILVCSLASLSFKADNTVKTSLKSTMIMQADCVESAFFVFDFYMNQGYNAYAAGQIADQTYDDCVASGGSPGDSVVVISNDKKSK